MFNENPKEETVIAMRNREIRLNREGEYWTDEETELVMKHEISDTELSKMLGRSVRAIQRRRHRFLYGE